MTKVRDAGYPENLDGRRARSLLVRVGVVVVLASGVGVLVWGLSSDVVGAFTVAGGVLTALVGLERALGHGGAPSRRPSTQHERVVIHFRTRAAVEAIDITKDRTTKEAAVARLVLIVPPARVDLVDRVVDVVAQDMSREQPSWPPADEVRELVHRVRRVHLGEIGLRGPDGVTVDVLSYVDGMGIAREVFRTMQGGVVVRECRTAEELARLVDVDTLVEDVS
jgi:hypothetical protein